MRVRVSARIRPVADESYRESTLPHLCILSAAFRRASDIGLRRIGFGIYYDATNSAPTSNHYFIDCRC